MAVQCGSDTILVTHSYWISDVDNDPLAAASVTRRNQKPGSEARPKNCSVRFYGLDGAPHGDKLFAAVTLKPEHNNLCALLLPRSHRRAILAKNDNGRVGLMCCAKERLARSFAPGQHGDGLKVEHFFLYHDRETLRGLC